MNAVTFCEARDHIVEAVRHVPDSLGIPLGDLVAKARIRRGIIEVAVYDSQNIEAGAFARAKIPARGLSTKMVSAMILSAIRASDSLAKTFSAIRAELGISNVMPFSGRNVA